jgi:hypothetical protein
VVIECYLMKTSVRRRGNPLTELRQLLGTAGRSLSMSKLAAFADVPAATLRSVETGRRSFNADLQKRLRRRGLDWDQKAGRWFFTYDRNAQLSVSLLESFRRLSRGDNMFHDLDAYAAMRRVVSLVQQVDESDYRSLLLDLNDALESLRAAYKVNGAQKDFAETELRYQYLKTASGSETLVKGYSWPEPPKLHRLFDLCRLQKSSVHLDESDQDKTPASATRPAA